MYKIDYYDYIQSPEWKARREEFIKAVGKCQKCGICEKLSVHHENYKNLGNETLADVSVLCWPCHKKYGHYNIERTPLPKTNKELTDIWFKDWKWRTIEPTLNFGNKPKELPVLIEKKPLVKMKDYRKEVYYDNGKFKPYTKITWLKKVNEVLKNMVNNFKKHRKRQI